MTTAIKHLSLENYNRLAALLDERMAYVETHNATSNVTRTLAESIERNRGFKKRMKEFHDAIEKTYT